MKQTGESVLKPFHESIVGVINGINSNHPHLSDRQILRALALIIKSTEILEHHGEIITAWEAQSRRCGLYENLGVVESVLAQKQAAEEAVTKKWELQPA